MVYSFEISNKWTFEDLINTSGSSVHGFNHTVDFPSRWGADIHFYKLGLGSGDNMKTLPDILNM